MSEIKTPPRPTALRLDGLDLVIQWSDGRFGRYSPSSLRKLCPCATCADFRRQELGEVTHAPGPAVSFREVIPVGSYAYKIKFSDGHDTGIYTLEYLYNIAFPSP